MPALGSGFLPPVFEPISVSQPLLLGFFVSFVFSMKPDGPVLSTCQLALVTLGWAVAGVTMPMYFVGDSNIHSWQDTRGHSTADCGWADRGLRWDWGLGC